jgi:oligosaccharide translocation protein RFT1
MFFYVSAILLMMTEANNFSSVFLRNAGTSAIFSIAQKLLLFCVNYMIVSGVSPETLGKISVRLELLLSTSLFLSREGIRLACLRYGGGHQYVINLSWITTPIALIVSVVMASIFFRIGYIDQDDFYLAALYILAILLETLVEPLYNLYQHEQFIKPKLTGEMLGLLSKTTVSYMLLRYSSFGLMSFGIAQCSYGLVYGLVLLSFRSTLTESNLKFTELVVIPKFFDITNGNFLPPSIVRSAIIFGSSSLIKHLLTEADKIATSVFNNLHDQGIYAFASNYGSIIARIVYLPIEDSLRLSVSRYVAANKMSIACMSGIASILGSTLLVVMFVGSAVALFGPVFVKIVLCSLMKGHWHSPEVIAALDRYCYYLFVLGINGTVEACLHSIITENKIFLVNIGYGVSSVAFVVAASIFEGPTAIINANIIAMVFRIIWSTYHMSHVFRLIEESTIHTMWRWSILWVSTYFALKYWSVWSAPESIEGGRAILQYLGGGAVLGLLHVVFCYLLLPTSLRCELYTQIQKRKGKFD